MFSGPALMYGLTIAATVMIFAGIALISWAAGWAGKRKATKDGRVCPHCGLWDEPVEILIHVVREHEHDRG